jgi:hypothetical protein
MVLVLPFLLGIWFGPFLLSCAVLRHVKRRITIGESAAWIAVLAACLALQSRESDVLRLLGLYALFAVPSFLTGLYLPRRWDVGVSLSWSAATLLAMLVLLATLEM